MQLQRRAQSQRAVGGGGFQGGQGAGAKPWGWVRAQSQRAVSGRGRGRRDRGAGRERGLPYKGAAGGCGQGRGGGTGRSDGSGARFNDIEMALSLVKCFPVLAGISASCIVTTLPVLPSYPPSRPGDCRVLPATPRHPMCPGRPHYPSLCVPHAHAPRFLWATTSCPPAWTSPWCWSSTRRGPGPGPCSACGTGADGEGGARCVAGASGRGGGAHGAPGMGRRTLVLLPGRRRGRGKG